MKKGIILNLCLAASYVLQAQEMNVHKTDGSVTSFPLTDIDKITFGAAPNPTSVTDSEGNVYKAVTIGTQIWMGSNLKSLKYADGTAISSSDFSYPGNSVNNKDVYGVYYSWAAASNAKNVCPTGWHVPSNAEWLTLFNYVGGTAVASGKLKEVGTTHWTTPNTGATDEVGFTSLPAGYREGNGAYSFLLTRAFYWSTTPGPSSPYGYFSWLQYDNAAVVNSYYDVNGQMSVRCLKD